MLRRWPAPSPQRFLSPAPLLPRTLPPCLPLPLPPSPPPLAALERRWLAASLRPASGAVAPTYPFRRPSDAAAHTLLGTCPGCGVRQQAHSPTAPGYTVVPSATAAAAGSAPGSVPAVLCRRCFQATHYGELVPTTVPYAAFRATLRRILAETRNVVVAVLDVTDFHGSFLPDLAAPVVRDRGGDVVVVVNKCDLLPSTALDHRGRLDVWVRSELKRLGLRVSGRRRVHFVSGRCGAGVDDLLTHILAVQRRRDVFVVGAANAGKSTLVNNLLRRMRARLQLRDEPCPPDAVRPVLLEGERHTPSAVTSLLPGTTVGLVSTPFVANTVLHDTPGVVVSERKQAMFEQLASQGGRALQAAVPRKPRTAPTIRLRSGRSLLLGGLAQIDYHHPDPHESVLLTWFGVLPLHITSTARVDDVWAAHAGGMLSPYVGALHSSFQCPLAEAAAGSTTPLRRQGATAHAHTRRRLRKRQGVADVVLSGLGWLCVTPVPVYGTPWWDKSVEAGVVSGRTAAGVEVHVRQPLLPFEAAGTKPKDWVV